MRTQQTDLEFVTVHDPEKELENLLEELSGEKEVIGIRYKGKSAIWVSRDHWNSTEETLYLLSIPGMRESILEGVNEPLDECSEEPGWDN